MSALVVRALAALRARPLATASAALGLLLAGVMIGAAVTTGVALSSGFDRAQRAAGTPDVIGRFAPVERGDVDAGLAALPNLADRSLRLVIPRADLAVFGPFGEPRFGSAEVNGLEPGRERDGLVLTSGRPISGRPGEAVIERGLQEAWGAEVGEGIALRTERGIWRGRIVGVSVEPDVVAFPLASRPRVYLTYDEVRGLSVAGGARPVNVARLRVVDRDRLAETLVQARLTSAGLSDVRLTTRAGVRALVDQAGGLVVALLVAFAAIALSAAAAMAAVAGHARVTRDLPTIGTLRALGATPAGLAGSYALEAALVALPAVALGIVAGSLLVAGPTGRLLLALNELAPPRSLGLAHLGAGLGAVALAALAAALPALAAARRPVTETLAGARTVRPRRAPVAARPVLIGARLSLGRPGRLGIGVAGVAASVATVLLMLALARFLVTAQNEPAAVGERYSLLVADAPGALPRVDRTPGVDAAAPRREVDAVDLFTLGEPFRLVAFGGGGERVFSGRPILEGHRARGAGEAEVGRGIAQSLGLEVGGQLLAQTAAGGEVRVRVAAIVQELEQDGRIAYVDHGALVAATPGVRGDIAVRPDAGTPPAEVRARLEALGLEVRDNDGLIPEDSTFLATVVSLLRVVAAVNGLVCVALVMLALVVLARERAETIAVLRASGGTERHVAALLVGAATPLVVLAVPLGYLLERLVLGPAVSGRVARYGALPLAPGAPDVVAVLLGAVVVAGAAAAAAAARYSRVPVVQALRTE